LTVGLRRLEWSGMVNVSQIRDRLIDFVANRDQEDALVLFEDWIAKHSWNMHLDSTIQAQKLVGEIQLYLAEMDAENRDYDWLISKFRRVLVSFPTENSGDQVIITTASSTTLKLQEWAFSFVGKQHVTASG